MVDIHCHIAPEMDDGAETLAEAWEMLSRARRSGTDALILTPHYPNTVFGAERSAEEYRQAIKGFIAHPKTAACGVALSVGAENYIGRDGSERIRDGRLIPLGETDYVLVEYSVAVDPNFLRDTLQEISAQGLRPVLAHVERYECLQRDHRAAYQLAEKGICLQVNRETVCGMNDRSALHLAGYLLEEDAVSVVASDAHDPFLRHADLSDADQALAIRFSSAGAQKLLDENPRRILRNESIY